MNKGKVALVTGGGTGIGRAIAVHLATEGWRVVVAGRSPDTLKETAELHGNISAVEADATVAEQAAAAIDFAVGAHGQLDALVNNAGKAAAMMTEGADMSVVAELFSVNVYAAANMVSHAIEPLARTRGAIVNISTATARVHSPAEGYYGASKAALEFLTKAWANEFAPRGVRVNAVAPGPVDSGQVARQNLFSPERFAELRETVAALLPLGRVGEPDDIARWVGHLVGPDGDWVTGQVFGVDGGMAAKTAWNVQP